MRPALAIAAALLVGVTSSTAFAANWATFEGAPVSEGQMRIPESERSRLEEGSATARKIPSPTDRFILEATRVEVEISGVLARVRLEQDFRNPYAERLEATYVFPLPEDAAVDGYSFRVGETLIEGVVKKRDEARREYEKARDEGRKGALLEEERANVFTQSVANIPPQETITVRIAYVHPVKITNGDYAFRFPMVVAPRYVPGQPTAGVGRGWSPDTDQVPDASRVTPPVLPRGMRAGNDVSIRVRLDAGMPIQNLTAVTHELDIAQKDPTTADIALASRSTIANKDFVLEYRLAGEQPVLASLVHRAEGDEHGYVALVVQPKRDVTVAEVTPREVILLMDVSGSMRGSSISQMRIVARHILEALDPRDTFRLVAFDTGIAEFDQHAVEATPDNIARGASFIRGLRSGSGTELLPALRHSLVSKKRESERPRYLVLLSDALVGNDDAILGYMRNDAFAGVRVFPIAIGAAPNHYLIERAAEIGRGFAMHVTNQDNATEMAARFNRRTRAPYITDLEIDWGGLAIDDVLPSPLPDLHAGEPLVVLARYHKPGKSTVRLRGNLAGHAVTTNLELDLPERATEHDAVRVVWARKNIRGIWNRNVGNETTKSRDAITQLGLEHQIVTRYTSFVAVEKEAPPTPPGASRSEHVATVLPEGMTEHAAPQRAFRRPRQGPSNTPAPTMRRAPTKPTVAPSRPAAPPPPSAPPPRTRRDRGGGFGFGGGHGGGSVEWIFVGALALLGAGSVAGRKRRSTKAA